MVGLGPALFTAVLAFATLYAPQPLLPRLASEFGVTADQAGVLISVTLVPMALAPLVYGAVLETVSARRVLRLSVLILAAGQLAFAVLPTFPLLVAARFVQGLALPAVLTSLMTYLASNAGPSLRRVMSIYVAATIVGGLSGRVFSGAMVAGDASWRSPFVVLGGVLAIAWLALGRLPADVVARFGRLSFAHFRTLLREPFFRRAYGVIFCVFFVFASILNVLPFRLKALDSSLGELSIAAFYSAYLIGVAVALASVRIAAQLGGEVRAIWAGLGAFLIAIAGFLSEDVAVLFTLMWLLCAGMFLVHALLSGLVNQDQYAKGVVNGAYLASYYLGGTLGASLPAVLIRTAGWSTYVLALAGMVAFAGYLALRLTAAPIDPCAPVLD